ncbi:Predicted oxidoreductase [Pseudonocardia thermophila]|uniref:Predicted oxidoreductase n=1 Tax=Pseudonocardia thermophila TaxID=1848 RepID=A0A1M6W0T2_PSETH|nr:aldo/keto reductase [Pseudonocardia thermophila]SHK87238.1 Predicted oxidoreductase [Pseudonocardia thermophila]
MEYTRLGSTGLKVSRICLGMMSYGSSSWRDWVLDLDGARPLVRSAVEAGVIFFDTADVYSLGASEEITGTLLREFFRSRDDYVLATKVYNPMGDGPNDRGLSRKHILASIDASLRRLGTDHVDLYQIHRFDYTTPIEETMEALHDVVRAGKARYIGASSMWTWQFATAQHVAERNGWTRFSSMQNHYNLLYREEEREMLPYCAATGVGVIPWSPLARGRLTRPAGADSTVRAGSDPFYGRGADESDAAIIDEVGKIAEARGVSRAQVGLAWLLHKAPVTAPIIGATKPGHVEDAIAAVELELTDDEVAALEAPYVPRPVVGHE